MPTGLNWLDPGVRPPTVLVVDDERHVRELLTRWLADEGWQCAQADNAAAALAHLESNEVEVVTSDLMMPGHSGLWLLEQVKARLPDTAVLMITASNETRMAITALTQGASGYLLKPVQREEFVFQVRQSWERRRLILENRQYTKLLEQRVFDQTLAIRLAHEETIHRLVTATMCRDEETGAHIRRTGLLSEALAIAAGWSSAEAEQLRMAAPMHDVGKIGIPDAILQKPGPLTPEEFATMKQHTLIGARMLSGSSSPVLQLAQQIALSHHEHWDGQGYPRGLSGDAIPEASRIVAIVDVFDALTHDRVYRPALADEMVLVQMRSGQGSHFDPGLVALFFTAFDQMLQINQHNPDVPDEFDEFRPAASPAAMSETPTLSGHRCQL